METQNYKIFEELKSIEKNYKDTSLEKIDGLKRSQYQVIKMCEYYSDSRYMEAYYGNQNALGRPVPFYNIVNYRVALAKVATDLDIKDIQIVADNPKYSVHSMLLNREVYEWMKKSEFSRVLNQMGTTRPKYGGYLVKKTEVKGELKIEVVKWSNVYTDQNDIMRGPIVECHYMSPVDLKKKDNVWTGVDDVLKAFNKTEDPGIEVFEVTGHFPVANFKDAEGLKASESDEYTYSLQRYFIAEIDGKNYKLYSEELSGELGDYYEYLSWEDNGFGLGRGVLEDSEEAQVWTNDAVINESIAMTLAGRVGIKTTSKTLGNTVLEHDHGKIYEIKPNDVFDSFNLAPSSLGHYSVQIEKWRTQADNVSSSYNALTGEQPTSGTPYSQTALLNQVASKPFDYKREEWGIHLTKIFDKWVLPHVIKKIKKEHVLVSEFTEDELEVIDDSFAYSYSNDDIKKQTLKGIPVSPEEQANMIDGYKKHIKKNGKKRYIEIPDDYFNDIECKVTVLTTGEQKNKAVILQSLSELMKTVIASFNPTTGEFGVLKDPTLSKIFNQILELAGSGISPVSLGKGAAPTKAPQANTSAGPVQSESTMPNMTPAMAQ